MGNPDREEEVFWVSLISIWLHIGCCKGITVWMPHYLEAMQNTWGVSGELLSSIPLNVFFPVLYYPKAEKLYEFLFCGNVGIGRMREKCDFFCWNLKISPNITANVLSFRNNSKSLCSSLQLEKWWCLNLYIHTYTSHTLSLLVCYSYTV